jgi:hypothetical protein
MKTDDIIPKSEQISKVINFIVSKSPIDNKVTVSGDELLDKFNYEFIDSGLVVTIDYNIETMPNQDYKVDEFWGDQIRIDIAAKNNGESLSKNAVKKLLKSAFQEYIDVINRKSQKYIQL